MNTIKEFLGFLLCVIIVTGIAGSAATEPAVNLQKIKAVVCQDDANCRVLSVRNREFRYINKWVIDVKAMVNGYAKPYHMDEDLNLLSTFKMNELDKSNRHEKFIKYGRKDPALFDYIQHLSAEEKLNTIPVAVWLQTSSLFVDRSSASAKAQEIAVLQEISEVENGFKKEAANLGLPDFDCDPNAPVCFTDLTVQQIDLLDKIEYTGVVYRNSTDFLSFASQSTTDDTGWTTWRTTCLADHTSADNVRVGIVSMYRPPEEDLAHLPGLQAIFDEQGETRSHTTESTASVYESDYPGGTGVNSNEYIANFSASGGGWNYWYQLEDWLDDYTVYIRNYSWGEKSQDGPDMSIYDRYLDYRAKHSPYPLHVGAAGNYPSPKNTDYVLWKDFNGLTVGGTDDKGTNDRSDDTIWEHSCWRNPASDHNDRELPEIVAPARNLQIAGYTDYGTSFSSPMVAGAAAAIVNYNEALGDWPEALRAILMATANQNVDGPVLNLNDTTDDKDGAGEVNEFTAVYLANSGNELPQGNTEDTATRFGYHKKIISDTDFSPDFPREYRYKFYVKSPADTTATIRAVLTWDSTAVCSDGDNETTCSDDNLDCDLDLRVYDTQTGEQVAHSTSWNNSYEFVQFQGEAGHVYRIDILASSFQRSSFMALAFVSLAND